MLWENLFYESWGGLFVVAAAGLAIPFLIPRRLTSAMSFVAAVVAACLTAASVVYYAVSSEDISGRGTCVPYLSTPWHHAGHLTWVAFLAAVFCVGVCCMVGVRGEHRARSFGMAAAGAVAGGVCFFLLVALSVCGD